MLYSAMSNLKSKQNQTAFEGFLIKSNIIFLPESFLSFFSLRYHSRCLFVLTFCTPGIRWSGPWCLCRPCTFFSFCSFWNQCIFQMGPCQTWTNIVSFFFVVSSTIVSQSPWNIVAAFFHTNFGKTNRFVFIFWRTLIVRIALFNTWNNPYGRWIYRWGK